MYFNIYNAGGFSEVCIPGLAYYENNIEKLFNYEILEDVLTEKATLEQALNKYIVSIFVNGHYGKLYYRDNVRHAEVLKEFGTFTPNDECKQIVEDFLEDSNDLEILRRELNQATNRLCEANHNIFKYTKFY